tara:strand:- start:2605 stop:4341 length:1737 start_codon:yes stop_codon:yes gene_type:complete
MKKLFLIVLLIPIISLSQSKDLIIFYDSEWVECAKKNAFYYRQITLDSYNQPLGKVKDYYITGEIQWEGYLIKFDRKDSTNDIPEGLCTWYYINGQPESIVNYSGGKQNGVVKRFYENGKIQMSGNFKNAQENGLFTYYFDSGQEEYVLNYSMGELNGEVTNYYKSGKLKTRKKYKKGVLDGKYLSCYENGICKTIFYDDFQFNKDWMSDQSSCKQVTENGLLFNETCEALINVPFDNIPSSYGVKSSIEFKSTGTASFIWGYADNDNFYSLDINSKGYVRIRAFIEGISLDIHDWDSIDFLNKKMTIKILQIDQDMYVAIDGEPIFTTDNMPTIKGSGFGFVSVNSSVLFNYLMIEENIDAKTIENDKTFATGTGFAINSEGYIATNYHVIEDSKDIYIRGVSGDFNNEYKAELIAQDVENDLAVLKINKKINNIPYILGGSELEVTEEVYAYGYPLRSLLGSEIKFTNGRISSSTGFREDDRFYQHTASIQPGNSGGPLFDSKGNIVGINSMIVSKKYEDFIQVDVENVFFSIKSKYLNQLINENQLFFNKDKQVSENISKQYKSVKNYIYIIEAQ